MAVADLTHKKQEGQYMTPDGIVTMILDAIGYKGKRVLMKKIMEPSFGDGAFLIGILQRIITEGKKQGHTNEDIADVISKMVYGIEKDTDLYNKAIERLNSLLDVYEIPRIDWLNLHNDDTLLCFEQFIEQMDYVVGNPPFVRIHNLDEKYREVLDRFDFANGMRDLYIVFYEIGLKMCNDKGRLGYISPNSFMKNTSQQKFRDYLVNSRYISTIYDFKTSKLFDADTYTCICILNKNKKRADFSVTYKEYQMYDLVTENNFDYDYFKQELGSKAWNLSSEEDIKFLEENKNLPIKVNTVAIVQNGIATNKDAVYVIKAYTDSACTKPYMGKHTDKKRIVYFEYDGKIRPIESTILHRCVKASKYNGNMDNTYIIFPYKPRKTPKFYPSDGKKDIESGYEPLTEDKLSKDYKDAYKYLLSVWDELTARDMDKNAPWYVFARSQGLCNSCFKKIVFKHIIDKNNPVIIPHILDEDVIVYSGMYTTIDINICISPKYNKDGKAASDKYCFNNATYDCELMEIKKIFESPEFAKYCSMVGKDMQGGYVGISTKMVKAFGTPLKTFPSFPVEIIDVTQADKNYMNKLFHEKFIECINTSYKNMGNKGKTSDTKVEPFHGYIAKVLQYKLGTEYDVYAKGYSYGKECNLGSNFGSKNTDICIKKHDKVIGAIEFKLATTSYGKNANNYKENMLGQAVQMRDKGLPYGFCYLIPEETMSLKKEESEGVQPFEQMERLTLDKMKEYYDICTDKAYKNRAPDALFIGVHKLYRAGYLEGLKKGELIDRTSKEYLDAIQPEWSTYDFVSDEDIREYFLEHSNIGVFLDTFIEKMIGKK